MPSDVRGLDFVKILCFSGLPGGIIPGCCLPGVFLFPGGPGLADRFSGGTLFPDQLSGFPDICSGFPTDFWGHQAKKEIPFLRPFKVE